MAVIFSFVFYSGVSHLMAGETSDGMIILGLSALVAFVLLAHVKASTDLLEFDLIAQELQSKYKKEGD